MDLFGRKAKQELELLQDAHYKLLEWSIDTHQDIKKLQCDIHCILTALGRLVAKLDPQYAKAELSPERKVESDLLGEAVIDKLKAEDWARRHAEGKA